MKVTPLCPVKINTHDGPRIYRPGEVLEANEDKARPFIKKGILTPVGNVENLVGWSGKKASGVSESLPPLPEPVHFFSRLLGLEGVINTDGSILFEDGVSYSVDEWRALKDRMPEEIRTLHGVRKFFPEAEIVSEQAGASNAKLSPTNISPVDLLG